MTDVFKDLDNLNDKDVYSLALLILFLLKNNPKYATLSELSYILDHDSFVRFMNYYSGQTIKIPTTEELSRVLKSIAMYQYHVIEGMDLQSAMRRAGYQSSVVGAGELIGAIRRALEDYRIGDIFNGER